MGGTAAAAAWLLCLTVLLPLLLLVTAVRPPREKPNVVLFFVDDLGYGDLGFTGHPSTSTPALDRLASLGMRLTSWYSAYPVCTSSRTALM
jgi:arylsulfatase A